MNKQTYTELVKLLGKDSAAEEHLRVVEEKLSAQGKESNHIRLGGLKNRGTNPFSRLPAPPNPPKPFTIGGVEYQITPPLWACHNCGAHSQANDVCDFCGGHEKL